MKKYFIYIGLALFLLSSLPACKAKHCTTLDPTMEGYNSKKDKRKKGRQEGLFPKGKRGF